MNAPSGQQPARHASARNGRKHNRCANWRRSHPHASLPSSDSPPSGPGAGAGHRRRGGSGRKVNKRQPPRVAGWTGPQEGRRGQTIHAQRRASNARGGPTGWAPTVLGYTMARGSGGRPSGAAVAVAASIDCQADKSVSRRRRRAPAHADHPQPAIAGGNGGPRRETAVPAGTAAAGSPRGGPSALLPAGNTGIVAQPKTARRPLAKATKRMQQQRRGDEARAAQRLLATSRAGSDRRGRVGGAVPRSVAVSQPTAAAGARRREDGATRLACARVPSWS